MASMKRNFFVGIALVFCVLYLFFIRMEADYKFDNTNNNIIMDDVPHHKVIPKDDFEPPSDVHYPAISSDSENSDSIKTTPAMSVTAKKTAIILFCEGRSGSTWLSSFFWRNPNVFYVYEPLYPLNENTDAGKMAQMTREEAKLAQIRDVYNCQLDYFNHNTIFPMPLGRYPYYQPELKACERTGSCKQSLTTYCNSKSHIVQKVIRVFNITTLNELNVNFPVKLIHLLRDPRPLILSREKIFPYVFDEDDLIPYHEKTEEEKSSDRYKLCQRVLSNLKDADSGMFGDSYFRIMHEEMSLKPLKWARKLYEFVGLEYTTETEDYINEITHPKYSHGEKDPDGRFKQFSVYRNSMKVLHKWKSRSSPTKIHHIEQECDELLKYLEYEPLYDKHGTLVNKYPWPRLQKEGTQSTLR